MTVYLRKIMMDAIMLSGLEPINRLDSLSQMEQEMIFGGGWAVDVNTNVENYDYSRNATTYNGGHAALGDVTVFTFAPGSNPTITPE